MSDHGEMLSHIKQKAAYVSQITQNPAIKEVIHRVSLDYTVSTLNFIDIIKTEQD